MTAIQLVASDSVSVLTINAAQCIDSGNDARRVKPAALWKRLYFVTVIRSRDCSWFLSNARVLNPVDTLEPQIAQFAKPL